MNRQKFVAVLNVIAQIVMALGGLASFLLWLGITPKDFATVTLWPHWAWLAMSLALFALSLASSSYAWISNRRRKFDEAAIRKIEKSGTLKSLAGQADWLAEDLERIWYEFNKTGKTLIYPLGINVLPDEIKQHTDKQLWAFRDQYRAHVGFVKSVDAEFHSAVIDDDSQACNGQDYLKVKKKIEAHAQALRERARSL